MAVPNISASLQTSAQSSASAAQGGDTEHRRFTGGDKIQGGDERFALVSQIGLAALTLAALWILTRGRR